MSKEARSKILVFDHALIVERDYWVKQLSGDPEITNLWPDFPRPETYSGQRATLRFELPDDVYRDLTRLTGEGSFLLYTTLMTALKVCLYKYRGSGRLVVGSPSRQRGDGQPQRANALAILDEVSGDRPFRTLLLDVRKSLLDAYAKQRYPFERLLVDLGLGGVENKCPLFDVALALDDIHDEMPDVKQDITITFTKWKRVTGVVTYNTSLFRSETVGRFVGHLVSVLRGALKNPAAPISELDLLTEEEREQLFAEWNATAADYPSHMRAHELFEAQAARTPEASAVAFKGEQLAYGGLNRKANRIARHLQSLGVGPGALVGICMEHSPTSVAGILGIVKTGAAYLPLDPDYPKDRISFMLEDAAVKVLLTRQGLAESLGEHQLDVIYLDQGFDKSAPEDDENLSVQTSPDDLAYVIYTSGSAGQPKGVEIRHHSLVNLITWHQRAYDLSPSCRATLLAAPAFDASVWELWPYLASGASLHIPDRETRTSASKLIVWLAEKAITITFMPTPLAEGVLLEPLPEGLVLRTLLTGGDKLRHYPGRQIPFALVNHYGPTESTVVTTCTEVRAGVETLSAPPIGRPIANTKVYLLNPDLQPVPVGVPGELYVGGEGLARGYLNRPELAAERFMPHPFGAEPGARLYRTGDSARYLPDGQIEFLGRMDDQVKIRGFRIELGEIEVVLCQHPSVYEAVATVREEGGDNKRLVAYVVANAERRPMVGELRGHLKEKLPDYMIPAVIVMLDEMPLTANGKLDLRALPAPAPEGAEDSSFRAPRTPIEELLAGAWAEVLGVERVGVEDNFFEMGGHSLLATKLISRLRETFQVELPLLTIFESPSVASLARVIEDARLQQRGLDAPPITPIPRDTPLLPLSFAQERLWILDQLEPDNPFYNVPFAVRLSGTLDSPALEQSLQEIVRRHEALRTRFEVVAARPTQVVIPSLALHVPVVDLSHLHEEESETEATLLSAREAQRPFDLSTGPLLRATVLRLNDEVHVLLLTMHHIVSDGWSIGIFIRELAALYEAFTGGSKAQLPELPIQYADFAVWQRGWLQGEVLESQLQYWKERLSENLPTMDVPTDRPRPPVQTFRGTNKSLALSKGLSEGLTALSRREGVTLFMTMLAAFKVLLFKYTGQEDVVVGTPIANRNRAEIEGLIGFFVNTLVLRTDLSGDVTFRELLARVREVSLGAYAHQDLPFEQLVELLQPQRDLSHTPLFQVAFALQNTPLPPLELPKLALNLVELESGTAKFDLTLGLIEEAQGIRGALEYNTDLFDEATAARMLQHFRVLLEIVAENPDARISTLQLLTETERRQLPLEWNDTATEYPKGASIHEIFEAQVGRAPDAIAASFGAERLTYSELNARANQLAHLLREAGVGPDSLVAICAERSLDMVVGLLGILKASGAYVPLEPSFPKERLAFMLEDVGAKLVLTQEKFRDTFSDYAGRVVCLDADWESISRRPATDLPSMTDAKNLAYVVYTSGSSGTPKGVAVSHRAVNRLVLNTNYVRLGPSDRVAQVSTASFDAATFEIWGALLLGGQLVGVTKETALSPRKFAEQIERDRITTIFLTTSLFNQTVREVPTVFATVRNVLFGGEAVEPRWVRETLEKGRPERLLHVYGPTESTTYTSWFLIDEVAEGARTIPIGHPISNTTVYLLDGELRPVPVGVPGELYVGGEGLARGYLNRPELTAERFMPHPFSQEPGARLYRTGDLARYRADGAVEFIGRGDQQVKIRGFRVELGEIEAALNLYPGVRDSVIVAREGGGGERHLAAYVVADNEQAADVGTLRQYLKEKLPEYMVPSYWLILDALPMTTSGKVDRRALPEMGEPRRETEVEYVAPRGPVEEEVARVWAEVLKFERVGVNDDFFDLGGHSLLATQCVSRLRDAFGLEVPLRSLFESPTVAGLSRVIEQALVTGEASGVEAAPQVPPIEKAPRADALIPLSFAQQRLWFLDQLQPDSALYNVPIALRFHGALSVSTLEQCLNEIVRRHEALRTTFASIEGRPFQKITQDLALTLPVINLSVLPEAEREEEARKLTSEEARRPFDLARGPLLRARLLRLAPDEHIALVTMHHIVSDGWSLGVLIREVAALYEAFSQGKPSPLPELPVQYADFAIWQHDWLRGETLESQIEYWRQQIGDSPGVLELPTDRPRSAVQTYSAGVQPLALPAELMEGMKQLSRSEGATLFMMLLAAFDALLYRYSAQEDISVGSPIANRRRGELEDLIGFFVNTVVIRTDLSGNPTFRELLGRVRRAALGAYAHQDLPFERLVEELQPERDMSHTPIFQVMFALQNSPSEALALPGLTLSPVETDTGATKFDLTLLMHEAEQGLMGALRYNAEHFDPATIERMTGHFRTLLEDVLANPDRRLSDLTILTETEARWLTKWSRSQQLELPLDRCIHEMFEEQVERTPQALAVVFEGEHLTYAELNRRANQLARKLRALGVTTETVVGIYTDYSPDMMVALLGILKASGAYVGFDPSLPRERLAYMLEDSRIALVVTQSSLSPVISEYGVKTLRLDADMEFDLLGGENLTNEASSNNLAYLIYTSGSTGRPKGVAGEHRQLLSYLHAILGPMDLEPGASFAMHQTLAVDAPITFIFASLCTGGVLHLVAPERAADPEAMCDYMSRNEIDYFKVAPSYLQALFSLPRPERVLPRRLLMVGGEAATWDLADKVRELSPGCVLLNHYGPTETTVGVLTYRVGQRPENYYSSVLPLGHPVANAEIHILDAHLNPVPVGIPGELHIGGTSLARGFLNRPDLTAERFIPDPFGERPGTRLYKSGDLARYLPDGNIEFLSRIDHQVKVRGFRIELGEIEAVLGEHPVVSSAVVVAREDELGDRRLVAYVVPVGDETLTISELRGFLGDKLPDYMIPAALVTLDALPRTPQGKVDRRMLPAPTHERPDLDSGYVAPHTETERLLAEVWADILKLERVGVNDNFFDLGGHSLLATQVIARLREVLRADLPLRLLFESPTVVRLAAAVEEFQALHGEVTVDQIKRVPRGDQVWDELLNELGQFSDLEVQALLAEEAGDKESELSDALD